MSEFTPSDFTAGGRAGQMAPSWQLCKILETAAGPGRDHPGLDDGQLTSVIGRWQVDGVTAVGRACGRGPNLSAR